MSLNEFPSAELERIYTVLHDAPLCPKQRRLLGDVYTLALSKTLTLLSVKQIAFSAPPKKGGKEIEESDLRGSASFKSIVAPARHLLEMFMQRWWRNAAAWQLTSLPQLRLGEAVSCSSRHFLFHWGCGVKTTAAEKADSHELRLQYISTHWADVGWDANQREVFSAYCYFHKLFQANLQNANHIYGNTPAVCVSINVLESCWGKIDLKS